MEVLDLRRGFQLGTVFSTASGAPFDIYHGLRRQPRYRCQRPPGGVTRNTVADLEPCSWTSESRRFFMVSHLWNDERDRGKQHLLVFSLDAFNVTNHTTLPILWELSARHSLGALIRQKRHGDFKSSSFTLESSIARVRGFYS